MDSNPSVKRGKEREKPKNKKTSTLKKIILKEREEKKRTRQLSTSNQASKLSLCSGDSSSKLNDDNEYILRFLVNKLFFKFKFISKVPPRQLKIVQMSTVIMKAPNKLFN